MDIKPLMSGPADLQPSYIKKQPVNPAEDAAAEKRPEKMKADEYISREKSSEKPSGLYKVVPDENGKRKILYDERKKSCTTNTDKVDREIEKLKAQKKELEQQIRSAAGDEEKIKELEKKLTEIENALLKKDNDSYRRQNASIS